MSNYEFPFSNMIAFDLETTGVDVLHDEPVSYALTTEDGQLSIYELVRPNVPVSPEAEQVHHITADMLASPDVRPLEDALKIIGNKLVQYSHASIPVVGMNLGFDLTITDRLLKTHFGKGLVEAGWRGPIIDVMVLDRTLDKFRRGKRTLTALCETYEVECTNAHNALADARVGFPLARAIFERYDSMLCTMTSEELLNYQDRSYRSNAHSLNDYRLKQGQEPITLYETWPILVDGVRWDRYFAQEHAASASPALAQQ